MTLLALIAGLAALVWAGLLAFRGGFWLPGPGLPPAGGRAAWPPVAVVIPARDEAPTIGRAVAALLEGDYPGRLDVVVVDDGSGDGTADAARAAAAGDERLTVLAGTPPPHGWTGKLWAVQRGLDHVFAARPDAAWVLLTDADIAHGRDTPRRLVGAAEDGNLDLVSLMVRLRCESAWEKLLIPAFVFFFKKLYPFRWVNDPGRRTAGAAGGCMLVNARLLRDVGGVDPVRGQVIDDCALAAFLKSRGAEIWLGLADDSVSLRPYDGLGAIWRMVARTAYVQLDHSPLRLAGAVLGMALAYLVPPLAAGAGWALDDAPAALLGAGAWAAMTLAYAPTARLYRRCPLAGIALPFVALLYTLMTVDSALRHLRGAGNPWKGRSYGADAREG